MAKYVHGKKQKFDPSGLKLAGKSLQAPNIIKTNWTSGKRFTVADDPDRVTLPWKPPAFITYQDPIKRRVSTSVQKLDISRFHPDADSFARVVHGVMSEKECAQFIEAINAKGFTPALINTGGGRQQYLPSYRKGWRMIVDNQALTAWLFAVLQPHIPESIDLCSTTLGKAVELNERCRFLAYEPHHGFKPHYDGCYTRTEGPKRGHFSNVTIQVYLHDIPEAYGGATTFLDRCHRAKPLPCQPRAGSVLIFSQDLYHEGSTLLSGLKYTFRTEVMYKKMAKVDTNKKKKKKQKQIEKPVEEVSEEPAAAASAPAPAAPNPNLQWLNKLGLAATTTT